MELPSGGLSVWRSGVLTLVFAAIPILAISCAPHNVSPPAEAPPAHSWYWVDLRPGWRVRVVTPVTTSGGYLVIDKPVTDKSGKALHVSPQAPPRATIDLKAGKDFLGYEVAIYSVRPQRGGGVRIGFRSAILNGGGKKTAQLQPVLPMFQLPDGDKFVRVLHLGWENHGDHDAAILAAATPTLLDSLARRVVLDQSNCVISSDWFCSWVPTGVAVIPERKKSAGGSQWTAAY